MTIDHETYTQVTFFLLVTIAVPTTAFFLSYHLLTRGVWARSPLGQNIMAMAGTMSALANLYLFEALFGRGWAFPFVLWTVLAVVAAVWWHRLYVLFDVNHPKTEGPRRRASDHLLHDLDHTDDPLRQRHDRDD